MTEKLEDSPVTNNLGRWILMRIPASKLDSNISPWIEESSSFKIFIAKKQNDNFYNIAVKSFYFAKLLSAKYKYNDYILLRFNKVEKTIYGTHHATKKTCIRWFQLAASIIYYKYYSGIVQVYRNFALLNSLNKKLNKKILIHEISVSL